MIIKSRTRLDEPLLNQFLDKIIQSKKQRTLQHWIQTFGHKEREIKKHTLHKLISKGILTKKEDKILWVIPYNKYPTKNALPENELRRRLSAIVELNKTAEVNDIMLLSLITAFNLTRGVFGKEKAKIYKQKIKTLVAITLDSRAISTTIKEVHELIMAMLVILITTTVIVTPT